jgi:hypothetical protein
MSARPLELTHLNDPSRSPLFPEAGSLAAAQPTSAAGVRLISLDWDSADGTRRRVRFWAMEWVAARAIEGE